MKIYNKLHKFLFSALLMIFCFSNIQCDSIKTKEFKENGVLTTATVAEVIKETRKKTKGSRLSTYYLKVSFFAKEKKSDEDKEEANEETKKDYGFDFLNKMAENLEIGDFTFAEISVSKEKANSFKQGDRVEIYYLPDEPTKAMLKEVVDKYQPEK